MTEIFETLLSRLGYQWTINKQYKRKYYKPSCKYGYKDCVCDPMYIKNTDSDWWKELGCPTSCKHCEDGNMYDDEDK